jgi:hypothetical protein
LGFVRSALDGEREAAFGAGVEVVGLEGVVGFAVVVVGL